MGHKGRFWTSARRRGLVAHSARYSQGPGQVRSGILLGQIQVLRPRESRGGLGYLRGIDGFEYSHARIDRRLRGCQLGSGPGPGAPGGTGPGGTSGPVGASGSVGGGSL
jgi:hypothetical protein